MDRRTALKSLAISPFVGSVPASNAVAQIPKDRYNLGLYSKHLPKIRANFHLMDFGLKIEDTCRLAEVLSVVLKQKRMFSVLQAVTETPEISHCWQTFATEAKCDNPFPFHCSDERRWPTWFVFQSLCLARTHGNDTIGWLNGEELQTAEERYEQNFREIMG